MKYQCYPSQHLSETEQRSILEHGQSEGFKESAGQDLPEYVECCNTGLQHITHDLISYHALESILQSAPILSL